MNRVLSILVAATAGPAVVIAAPGAASAAPRTTQHVVQSFGPVVTEFPAGTICDFGYHQEVTGTQNLKRFFDGDGNLVRAEDDVVVTVLHRNADTGYTLTETDHYAVFVDFVSGEATTTGQSWHLVDGDGRLVLSGAGSITADLLTGELLDATPHAQVPGRLVLCPALGGAVAS